MMKKNIADMGPVTRKLILVALKAHINIIVNAS